MTYFYLVPKWFLKFGIGIEIFFAVIAFAVALFAIKIYGISRQREIRLFGVSFFLISFSYLILALINLAVISPTIIRLAQLTTSNIARLGAIGVFSYTLLFISGLITLVYTTLRIKSWKVYYIILSLSLIIMITPLVIVTFLYDPIEFRSLYTILLTFRILSVFLLTFILYNYVEEYVRKKNKKTLLVVVAFSFLLISNAEFIFSFVYYEAYIMGHILEFIAYLFILLSLILTIKK